MSFLSKFLQSESGTTTSEIVFACSMIFTIVVIAAAS